MKLVWLLYQQRQRSSLAPLQKKSPFSPQMTMFLVEAAKWLVSSAVVVALCARSSTLFRPSVVMGALFFMSVSPFIGVLLESKEGIATSIPLSLCASVWGAG
ncbi:hypothetical protein ABEV40_08725 [Geobacillus thermocatenulatus]|uniref:hypothetical protein n=1 Tax=Geobacillus thermocatenulatus TaxID=33938 RepID=UPI003D218761